MASTIDNPAKEFQFRIVVMGFDPAYAQKAKLPDIDFDITEHGDAGHIIKTAGLVKLSKFSLDKLMPADKLDEWIWTWVKTIRNFKTGGGVLPSIYKRDIMVQQFSYDGFTPVRNWLLTGAWPSKVNGISFDKVSSQNTVTSIEFEVDEMA